MANWTNFSTALAAELQTGFLEREFEEGLDSILGYRREALQETFPARLGETITRTRVGRKVPIITPMVPSSNTQLDNGLTSSDASLEQYILTLFEYAATTDVNIMDDEAAIADNLERVSRNNGVQAAQSLERIARKYLFNAYVGGNSYVRTDLGASSTTTCHVDDVTGFSTVLVNGVPTPVSGTNTLSVTEVGTTNQTLTVTAYTVDGTNNSQRPDGQSGTITFSSATAPSNGDQLLSANAASILRPFGRSTTAGLQGGDVLTLGILQDAVTLLRNNAVPPCADGTYHVVLDNTSMRQLFADQDFKVLYAGRYQSQEFASAEVIQLLDMTFIPTTEAYVQSSKIMGWSYTSGVFTGSASTATSPALVNVNVRRPIVLGAECVIQGNFEGLEMWLRRQGVDSIAEVMLVDNVAHIIRPPLDRLQQFVGLSWVWIGGFAIPTDLTATNAIIPTASNALYKRAVIIEHAS